MNNKHIYKLFCRRAYKLHQQVLRLAWQRRSLVLGLVGAVIVVLPIPSTANDPSAARVFNFGERGRSGDFQIQPKLNAQLVDVNHGVEMTTGGWLYVPSEGYWVTFAFVGGDSSYDNLLVKTQDRGTYIFPCRIQGNFIIGWNGTGSPNNRQGPCSQGDNGIEIDRTGRLRRSLSRLHSLVGLKQAETPAVDVNLSVVPGDSQTVIRVTSTPFTTQVTQRRTVTCNRLTCPPGSGDRFRLSTTVEETVEVETERVTIEVLEGDVAVQAEGEPSATTVSKGQRYVYPNPALDSFDPSQAGSSCEMLHFLNPATHLVDDELPSSLVTGITAQLKDHRNAMGVTGRPPSNLSTLEQAVVAELNRARTNPQGYADLGEANKQDFYDNWLQLPGRSLDPNERRRLVNEAIASLRQRSSLPELDVSDGMSRGNQDHIQDQGESGLNRGHTGDNLSGPMQRLSAHGRLRHCRGRDATNYDAASYENVVYVDSPTAQRVVMEMLIDDNLTQAGYEDAGNLDNLFSPDFQVMGVACGEHKNLSNMCVITYASGYLEGT